MWLGNQAKKLTAFPFICRLVVWERFYLVTLRDQIKLTHLNGVSSGCHHVAPLHETWRLTSVYNHKQPKAFILCIELVSAFPTRTYSSDWRFRSIDCPPLVLFSSSLELYCGLDLFVGEYNARRGQSDACMVGETVVRGLTYLGLGPDATVTILSQLPRHMLAIVDRSSFNVTCQILSIR